MEKIYPYFPLSMSVLPGQPGTLFWSVIIYLVICAVLGLLQFILGWIPLAGWVVELVSSLLGLYCVAGIVLSVLKYVRGGQ